MHFEANYKLGYIFEPVSSNVKDNQKKLQETKSDNPIFTDF